MTKILSGVIYNHIAYGRSNSIIQVFSWRLLPQLDTQLADEFFAQLLMKPISLFVGQRALQTPVVDPVAHALPAGLRMCEFIDEPDVFDEIARHATDDLHDIVLVDGHGTARRAAPADSRARQPERHILVAGGVLGEGLEAGDLAGLELREEALVAGPEESNVGDVEEEHGDALEAQPEGPADAVRHVRVDEQVLLDDAAA